MQTHRPPRARASLDSQPQIPRLVALVIRVSTTRQADNDEGSLKNQLQRLHAHLAYKTDACGEDWQEVARYELKAVSGKHSLHSPEMLQLTQDIEAGRVNTVLCTALDRVSRSVVEFLSFFELLAAHGAEFVCLKQNYDTTTPQGRLFVTIMMALAQFEREQTADRTRDAVAARAERGLWNGGRILGFDSDPTRKGYLIVNEPEAEAVRFTFASYIACGSLAATAERLNVQGYRTKAFTSRRGIVHPEALFHLTGVQYLLKNLAYVGLKQINKERRKRLHDDAAADYRLVPAVWPALIDRAVFDRVQALMAQNGQHRTNQTRSHRHVYLLGSGLLWCGACRTQMEARSGTGRLGKVYFYYTCRNPHCSMRMAATEIEDAILDRLAVLARDPDLVQRLVAATNARLQRLLPRLDRHRHELEQELAPVTAEMDDLLADWSTAPDLAARGVVAARLGALSDRQEELRAAIRDAEGASVSVQGAAVDAALLLETLGIAAVHYPTLEPFEQKALLRLLIQRVTLRTRQIVLDFRLPFPDRSPSSSPSARPRVDNPPSLSYPLALTPEPVLRDRWPRQLGRTAHHAGRAPTVADVPPKDSGTREPTLARCAVAGPGCLRRQCGLLA